MIITRIDDTFSSGNKFGYKLRIKCDCGKIFETQYTKEVIWKPSPRIDEDINFKFCPYCARKIELEKLER